VSAKPGAIEPVGLAGAKPGAIEPVGLAGAKPGAIEPVGLAGAKPGAIEPVGLAGAKPGAIKLVGLAGTESGAIKFAGLAGILSIALGLVGAGVDQMWTFPGTGSTAAAIANFSGAHRSALLIAMFLNTIAVGLWLVFGVGVWLRLREATGGESMLSACFMVGLVSFIALLFAGFTSFFVLVYRAPATSDPRLLYDLSFGLLAMSGVPTALALGSYALLVFRSGCLPAWTASVAAVAALAHLVLFASLLIASGFFSLDGGVTIAIPALLFAWILATSVALRRDFTPNE
jgi:hypothetical protein